MRNLNINTNNKMIVLPCTIELKYRDGGQCNLHKNNIDEKLKFKSMFAPPDRDLSTCVSDMSRSMCMFVDKYDVDWSYYYNYKQTSTLFSLENRLVPKSKNFDSTLVLKSDTCINKNIIQVLMDIISIIDIPPISTSISHDYYHNIYDHDLTTFNKIEKFTESLTESLTESFTENVTNNSIQIYSFYVILLILILIIIIYYNIIYNRRFLNVHRQI